MNPAVLSPSRPSEDHSGAKKGCCGNIHFFILLMKITAIIVIIFIIIVAGMLLMYRPARAPLEIKEQPAMVPENGSAERKSASPTETRAPVVIEMNDRGFSPVELTIPAGTTVQFVNRGMVARWPASDVHPTHRTCPGFDALRPFAAGESYTYTFAEAKVCPLHDHLHPSVKGVITVK